MFDVLEAWDYAWTIFRSEQLRIAYIKAETCTGKHICWLCLMAMCHGYVSWLCIMAMYHGHVSWPCIMAMYHGHVSWLCITAMYLSYVAWPCIMAMHHGSVSWLCIMAMYHGFVSAMYHGYVSWLCILSQKVIPQGPFGQIKLHFELEKYPAGAFWADQIVFWVGKASRRAPLGGTNSVFSQKSV